MGSTHSDEYVEDSGSEWGPDEGMNEESNSDENESIMSENISIISWNEKDNTDTLIEDDDVIVENLNENDCEGELLRITLVNEIETHTNNYNNENSVGHVHSK